MTANDVYNVAKALSRDELNKLCNMLNGELLNSNAINNKKRSKSALPDFTLDDGVKYLIENHFAKNNN